MWRCVSNAHRLMMSKEHLAVLMHPPLPVPFFPPALEPSFFSGREQYFLSLGCLNL